MAETNHIPSARLYLAVFGGLIALTLLTIMVSFFHLGAWNLAIAFLIATAKGSLVVTYFMHLKWDTRFNTFVLLGALLFGGLFLSYTLNDTAYRTEVDPEGGARFSESIGEWAAGLSEGVAEPVFPVGHEAPGIEEPVMPPEGSTVIQPEGGREVEPRE